MIKPNISPTYQKNSRNESMLGDGAPHFEAPIEPRTRSLGRIK